MILSLLSFIAPSVTGCLVIAGSFCNLVIDTHTYFVCVLCGAGYQVSALGIGAWSWGDRTGYWGFENQGRADGYGEEENRYCFRLPYYCIFILEMQKRTQK